MGIRDLFLLDEDVVFLNHGSFGACPEPVFRVYQEWQRELERNPVELLARRLPGLLAEVRAALAAFVGADAEGLLLVPNATAAVNTVARSLELGPGDEVLATDQEYGAMELAWREVCVRAGATYVAQPVELPAESQAKVADEIWAGVNTRTRVLFVSQITSLTAMRMPVEELCRRARDAGIVTAVDGAHGPGQLDLDLQALGADFYAGNCHKWLCAPKSAGFLVVRHEHREALRPLVVSWGWRPDAPFSERHGWEGTRDPAAYLSLPAAIEFQQRHDWAAVRITCHELLAEFRPRLGVPLTPDGREWFVQMAAVEVGPCDPEDVQRRLREEHGIEALVQSWRGRPLLRVSVQGYNVRDDLERLAEALPQVLELGGRAHTTRAQEAGAEAAMPKHRLLTEAGERLRSINVDRPRAPRPPSARIRAWATTSFGATSTSTRSGRTSRASPRASPRM